MAPISKEATIGIAVTAGVALPIIAYGVYNREKTQELSKSAYAFATASASSAAAKSSDALKAVQSSASASYASVSKSVNGAWSSLMSYIPSKSSRALKRVKSFPVTLTEEDLLDINAGKRRQQRPKKQAPPSPVKVAAAEAKAPITLRVTAN